MTFPKKMKALERKGFPWGAPWVISLIFALLAQCFLVQSEKPWTLWAGLFFVVLSFWKFEKSSLGRSEKPEPPAPGFKWEVFLFILIFSLGLFFRVYRMEQLSIGLHTDSSATGLAALRILHEGWRPFYEIYAYHVPELLLSYQLAGWFDWFGSGAKTFHLFMVFLSMGAFPFIYWTYRQLAGARVALLSLFLLAVMAWHTVETRNGYPSLQVPLYLFGTLAFFRDGVQNRRRNSLLLSALFCGFGLYTYQAFKVVPLLMLALAVFELKANIPGRKISRNDLFSFFLVSTLLALPLLGYMVLFHTLGSREAVDFIGKDVVQDKSLAPFLKVAASTALMFHRTGDLNPWHNLPGRRMLDDGTGVLFLLGLFIAWRGMKLRGGFYPLAGFFILSLTSVLSMDLAPSNRLVILTPFVAYFAGLAGVGLWDAAAPSVKKITLTLLSVMILFGITAQNFHTYFFLQAADPGYREGFGPEQNEIGSGIARLAAAAPGQFHFFVDPAFHPNYTVDFLGYRAGQDTLEFNLEDWTKGREPIDKDAVVILAQGKSGVLEFLRTIFPRGRLMELMEKENPAGFYVYVIGREFLKGARPWPRGLTGVYRTLGPGRDLPVLSRQDPVLNFFSIRDFPFTTRPPFRARWTGTLTAPGGDYKFQVLTEDRGALWLDGIPVPLGKPIRLSSGSHALRLDYEKDSGYYTELHLVWKKSGAENWEVIPAQVFGKIKP